MCETTNHKKCLLLNADYTPFGIIEWTKAMIWSIKNDAKYSIDIVNFYKNDSVQAVNRKYPVPAVARTKKFYHISKHAVNFNRKNILIRDNFLCQYCEKKFSTNELTYDHVIPKSLWNLNTSPTSWTNIVSCCIQCNRKKSNKTPKQAGMKLSTIPIQPRKTIKYLPVMQSLATIDSEAPDEWKPYLPQF